MYFNVKVHIARKRGKFGGNQGMEQKEAQSLFSQLFGGEAEDLFTAAGRINVIGEHGASRSTNERWPVSSAELFR